MKSAHRTTYGPPEVLSIREAPIPVPKDNQLLIRVHAATVNRTDCGGLWGKPYIYRFFVGWPRPRHAATGTDFAGVVEAVGKNVSKFKVGEKVWGFNDHCIGTHAQYFTISENGNILTIPDGITYAQAAASIEGMHYARNFSNKVKINPGDNILVNGATGAIGSAAVQLCKYYGANVTAVCDTKNLDLVKSLGADSVIDYMKEDFTTSTQRYHFVLDAVGKSSFGKCKPLLHEGGVYISSELGPGNENLYLPLTTRFSSKRLIFPFPSNIKESMRLVKQLLETNRFHPVIDRTYPLEQIAEAYHYVNSGQKIGNVLLTFEDQPQQQ